MEVSRSGTSTHAVLYTHFSQEAMTNLPSLVSALVPMEISLLAMEKGLYISNHTENLHSIRLKIMIISTNMNLLRIIMVSQLI